MTLSKIKKPGKPRLPAREFYIVRLPQEKDDSAFSFEYSIFTKTAESVNSFDRIFQTTRTGSKGPSKHIEQDLYRAMLIFACAGLDVFVKQLVKSKLPQLLSFDVPAQQHFKEYVRGVIDIKKTDRILDIVALALIDEKPRDVLLAEYIGSMTSGSMQSHEQLFMVCNASGLSTNTLLTKDKKKILDEAFFVRNQIIHEMDITTTENSAKTKGYRTRRTRSASEMKKHSKALLDFIGDLFVAYKDKFEATYKVSVKEEPTR